MNEGAIRVGNIWLFFEREREYKNKNKNIGLAGSWVKNVASITVSLA